MAAATVGKNGFIEAKRILIGKNVEFGSNIDIKIKGTLKIGDNSKFVDDVKIRGNDITFGKHFYHGTQGLDIGGGGSDHPEANLIVGDRCVFHNNYINLARTVRMGNDVGLSPDVQIITHGFWASPLEGFPYSYSDVFIQNNVIIGQRSMILPGAHIESNCIIGAQSVVSGHLETSSYGSIYAGVPARLIKDIEPKNIAEKERIIKMFVKNYEKLTKIKIKNKYPWLKLNKFELNVETLEYKGEESFETDNFRDFLRRYGIRIYTDRPFGNAYK